MTFVNDRGSCLLGSMEDWGRVLARRRWVMLVEGLGRRRGWAVKREWLRFVFWRWAQARLLAAIVADA